MELLNGKLLNFTNKERKQKKNMENFYYAQLDAEHFCVGLSQLSGEVIAEDMVRIDTYDINLLGLKYDVEAGEWTDERRPEPEEPTVSHDDEIRDELMKELISKGIL